MSTLRFGMNGLSAPRARVVASPQQQPQVQSGMSLRSLTAPMQQLNTGSRFSVSALMGLRSAGCTSCGNRH